MEYLDILDEKSNKLGKTDTRKDGKSFRKVRKWKK